MAKEKKPSVEERLAELKRKLIDEPRIKAEEDKRIWEMLTTQTTPYVKTAPTKHTQPVQRPGYKEIAMYYRYLFATGLHEGITEKNKKSIVKRHGYAPSPATARIWSHYLNFKSEKGRITAPIGEVTDKGHKHSKSLWMQLIRNVIAMLEKDPLHHQALSQAKKELEKLEEE